METDFGMYSALLRLQAGKNAPLTEADSSYRSLQLLSYQQSPLPLFLCFLYYCIQLYLYLSIQDLNYFIFMHVVCMFIYFSPVFPTVLAHILPSPEKFSIFAFGTGNTYKQPTYDEL